MQQDRQSGEARDLFDPDERNEEAEFHRRRLDGLGQPVSSCFLRKGLLSISQSVSHEFSEWPKYLKRF